MSDSAAVITPSTLRAWQLPGPGGSKYGRGHALVVGGAARTPGGALLAGVAVLRAGAGYLQLAVAESVAPALGVAVPEAGVLGLPEADGGSVRGDAAEHLESALSTADVVLVGPGLDEPENSAELLAGIVSRLRDDTRVVLDAYALGVLPGQPEAAEALHGRVVLTPNSEEVGRLLDRDSEAVSDDIVGAALEIAERYGAVVCAHGNVASPDGDRWEGSTGHSGLGTSGSGDVMAGVVTGLLARGADLAQAACWGSHLHASAGDRLAARLGPLGFLARDLLDELPLVLTELS